MRFRLAAAALAVAVLVGCKSKESTVEKQAPAVAPLVDITAQSSLKDVRAAFNARKGEARFLTLLSPT